MSNNSNGGIVAILSIITSFVISFFGIIFSMQWGEDNTINMVIGIIVGLVSLSTIVLTFLLIGKIFRKESVPAKEMHEMEKKIKHIYEHDKITDNTMSQEKGDNI